MKKGWLRKIIIGSGLFLLLSMLVLVLHIYLVTRPHPADAHTLVLARIDFKQKINSDDADKITAWLYHQQGVNHVLCNPKTSIAIFSFFRIKTSADQVISKLKKHFDYKAERFVPTQDELKSGCPVATNSPTYKIYQFFKHVF